MALKLRCFAEKQGKLWVAVCVDLCLAAQAYTADEAITKLNAQVDDYLNEAFSDRRYTHQMLSRKAPLPQRLKYRYYAACMYISYLLSSRRTQTNSISSEATLWNVPAQACS